MSDYDNGGWMGFCGKHFVEAYNHLVCKHIECDVGWCHTIRDDKYDTDETMKCDYPECKDEMKYEILWLKWNEDMMKSSEYIPLSLKEEEE